MALPKVVYRWRSCPSAHSRATYIRCGQVSEPDERLFSLTMHPSGSPLATKMSTRIWSTAAARATRSASRQTQAMWPSFRTHSRLVPLAVSDSMPG